MGNWRTVNIIGSIDPIECKDAISFLTTDSNYESKANSELGIYYLQFGEELCGIGNWINNNGDIHAIGNLWERDCSIIELEDELKKLANRFKSLDFKLHAGDEYEDLKCVATFVISNGCVTRLNPEIEVLQEINSSDIISNLYKQLLR